MDCSKFPSNYSNLTLESIHSLLKEYSYQDLLVEALKPNAKAQHAIIVKLERGLHEFENMNAESRLESLLTFWTQIRAINEEHPTYFHLVKSGSIGQGIIGITMGSRLYHSEDPLPTPALISYSLKKMKEYKIDPMYAGRLKDAYKREKGLEIFTMVTTKQKETFQSLDEANSWLASLAILFDDSCLNI